MNLNATLAKLPNIKQILIGGDEITVIHKNGQRLHYTLDRPATVLELGSFWLKIRLQYFNDHGSMTGF